VITPDDWALIRGLAAEGVPNKRIAGRLGISRTAVMKAMQSDSPPSYERRAATKSFPALRIRGRVLLKDDPDLPAVVIAERVGLMGPMPWFRQNVKWLRPDHRKIDPADWWQGR
jgi:transcriptional regulator with XRE-family HTH domain